MMSVYVNVNAYLCKRCHTYRATSYSIAKLTVSVFIFVVSKKGWEDLAVWSEWCVGVSKVTGSSPSSGSELKKEEWKKERMFWLTVNGVFHCRR
jgi:hypothetical protein